jgi:hypothetical protein
MTPARVLLPLVAFVLSACASSYRVVQVPQYGADLYPQAQTRSGITVAVEEMKNPERVERMFGADLIKEGILPVNVVVSNFGKQRLLLKPSDILLYQGKEVMDPLPVEMVMATAKRQKIPAHQHREGGRQILRRRDAQGDRAFPRTKRNRGIMFFAVPAAPKRTLDRFFTSWSVFREDGPKMRIGITNLDSGERVLFAPFSVKLPETAGAFSY